VWVAIGLSTAILFTGCADSNYDPTKDWSNDKLYNEAKDEMAAGAYDKAIGMYEKLEGRAAGTALAQQAQLDKAWAQYKTNEPIQAVATLDRFIKLHPASPALDYALYLKGLVNFNDNLGLFSTLAEQDLAERDPKQAKESFEAFRELVTRFPTHGLHQELIGTLRCACGALLFPTWRLCRRHQPRSNHGSRVP
jgi:outer membrane protein assembly factor BamD